MDKQQMLRELKARISWLHREAAESTKNAKKSIDEADFYLNIINLLENKREGESA